MKKVFGIFMTVLCVFAVLTAAACKKSEAKSGAAGADDDYVFKIGFTAHGSLCYAPLYIAEEKGYYEEEGLKYEVVFVGDGEAMNLLTNGSVDGTFGLLLGLIQPLSNGLPVKVPLAVHTGCIKTLVRGDSDIRTAADLKGKKIGGGSPTAPPVLFMKRVLVGLGYKVDGENADVEFIYQSAAELPLLLERGIVDAIGLTDPAAQIATDSYGFRAAIDNGIDENYKDEYCCMADVRTETLKKYPEAVAKYLRAVQKGAKFVQEHPEETAQILAGAKRIPGDPVVNGKILKSYNYRASVSQVLPALERNARDLQKMGVLKPDVDIEKLIQDAFIAVPGVPDSLF